MSTPSELRNDACQECADMAEAEAHFESHVGNTCQRDCFYCERDHAEEHVPQKPGAEWGSYRPQYDDCAMCEAAWYEGQQRDY